MIKPLLTSIFLTLSALVFAQTAPNITYSSPKVFTTNVAITPLAPVNSGGAVSNGIYGATSTFAGNGNALLNDGIGVNASFYTPSGVATDNAGNIYVADQNNNAIRKITPAGVVTTLAGNGYPGTNDGTGSNAYFNNPCGVAVDATGNVYVTDRYNNHIRKITPAGVVTTLGSNGYFTNVGSSSGTPAYLYYPYGITIDASGNLFVTEQLGQKIDKITPSGTFSVYAGNGSLGSINGASTQATFYNPTGVAFDAAGNLFVTDNMGNLVRKITPSGVVSTFAGNGNASMVNGTGTSASFNQPTGVNIDQAGNIYIADQGNNMIRVITPGGVVTTLAGNGNAALINGTGTSVAFFRPTSITLSNNNLYVADYSNNVIRAVGISGYAIYPALPDGLTFDAQTGIISGTPTSITAAKDYTVTALNNYGTSTATVNISTVIPAVAPTATSFSPTNVVTGAAITITGTNLLGATGLTVGGVSASSFTVVTNTKILAIVPAGAASGSVTVTNPYGTVTLTGLTVAIAPAITYTTPHSYPTGTAITALSPTNSGGAIGTNTYSQVTTFAGSGTQQSTNGTGTAASFSYPAGMTTDAQGNIYVAETYGNVIRKITQAGVVTTFAGSGTYGSLNGTATAASFASPIGITFDPSGNMFVADKGSSLIRKITPAGVVSTFAGNSNYNYTIVNGVGTAASFNGPAALVADAAGNLYVADASNNAIRKITPDGTVTTFVSGTLNYPSGIAIDGLGNLYVADRSNNMIKKITPAGAISILAGNGVSASVDGPGTSASFASPTNITIDAAGNLYVTENAGLIRMITQAGIVTTLAGRASANNSIDGVGANAGFSSPWGITADGYGNLYVSDQFSNKIRKISITGYLASPALPAGLSLDNTGTISGTPMAISTATDYIIKAVNIAGTSIATVNIATPIPAVPPTITSITPGTAGYGKTIIITGTNLLGATSVKIGTVDVPFAAISPFTINVLVNTSTSGSISVTNPYGTATSSAFVITQLPNITYTAGSVFTVGTAIANLSPTNNGGAIPNAIYAQTSTFAGNGTYGNSNGTGTAAIIALPQGAVVDANNNLYITDSYNQIRKITPAGVVTTFAGSGSANSVNGPGGSAAFNYPRGLAIDIAGNIYVADQSNHQIRKITPAGDVTTLAGSGAQGAINGAANAASFNYPSGVAVDAGGNVFVADKNNNLIRKITPQGVVTTFAGSGVIGSLNGTGTAATFNGPSGLAFDAKGNLYVADEYNALIRKITPAGIVTTYAGSTTGYLDGTTTTAKFNNPFSLTVNGNGDVYVADMNNNAVRKISTDGTVVTLSGNGSSGIKDGIGQAASFSSPAGIALDGDGNLFVADGSNLIRKVITTGYTITATTTPLPDGLSFNAATGILSGTPTISLTTPTKFAVYGTNSAGTSSTTFDFTIKIPAVAPAITSITPTTAGINNAITITGTNFTDATAVEIGGVVAVYKVVSPTTIVALVGAGSTGPTVKVTNVYGNGSYTGFTFIPAPTITYTGPQTYKTGTAITPLTVTTGGSTIPNAIYGKTNTIAGGPNLPSVNLFQLNGIVADASGNTFAISSTSNVIYKITPAGGVSTFAGSATSGFTNGTGTAATFNSPKALSIDVNGNLYVLEPNNYAIRKITPQGVVSTYATYPAIYNYGYTASSITSFVSPSGMAIDKFGNLFISDSYTSKIGKISTTGVITIIAGTGSIGAADGAAATATFSSPQGLAIDDLDNLYVADRDNQKIRKITPDGIVSTLAGSGTTGKANGTGIAASFASPSALTVDAAGNVYLADTYNNLIRKITPAGVVTTLAGSGTAGYVDQIGAGAYFNSPSAIYSDASGNVYVTESYSNSIRKIASAGYTISPALSAGLSLDGTGSISGTPTEVSAAKDYTVTAYNSAGVGTATVNIGVVVPTVAPVITTFAQASQNPGSGVTITGNNFIGATAVTIGGMAAASYTVVSPTTIIAYASPNAASGSVKITNPYGTATQAGLIYNTAPQIAYAGTLNFTAGTAITPIVPTNSGSAIPAQAYGQFITIAGNGSSGSVNGTGTAASFSGLNGTVVDKTGNIFVADGAQIRKVTPAGVVTTFADLTYTNAGNSTTYAQLSGIVMDASGNLFVVDRYNSLIRKVTPAGVVSTFVGTGNYYASNDGTGTQASIYLPSAITIDGSGNLYVTENGGAGSKIRKITPSGVVTTLAGGSSLGSANNTGMAASFYYPNGIVADFYGNLYIADTNNNLIRKVTPSGVVTTIAGSGIYGATDGTGTAASFSNPCWLSIDASGNLYVSDAGGRNIRKISTAGVVTTIANLALASNASANYYSGSLSVDASGNLIIGDLNNYLLRKFSLTGYAINPALPAGFNFDGATGVISGTPQLVSTTPLSYTVTGYNAAGSNTTNVSFTVGAPAAPKIAYAGPQTYTVSNPINYLYPTNTGGGVPSLGYGYTTTLAGSGVSGMANGSGLAATFNAPSGIIVDKQNNIYVAQAGNPMIRKITPDGTVSTFAGNGNSSFANGPIASASFDSPIGLAINSKGDMFVTDGNDWSNGYTIRKISNGVISTFAGDPNNAGFVNGTGTSALFRGSYQIAIDKSDNIFVADQQNNVIRKITPAAIVTTFAGSGTQGATDGAGSAASFYNPDAIAIDANGNLFVTDTKNNRIRKITPDGVVSTFAGNGSAASIDGPGTSASFNYPTGIAIDASGNLYVTDYRGNVVRKITPAGMVTTIAGNSIHASTDTKSGNTGDLKNESFSGPVCITVSNDSQSLYVTDFDGNRIRQISLYGYTIDKPLPSGLFLDPSLGYIYGIPAAASTAANYTITAFNAGGTSSATVNIAVAKVVAPSITYAGAQHIGINQPATILLTNNGGSVPANVYATTGSQTSGISNPIGVVTDKLGHSFVADQSTYSIREVNGNVVSYFAGGGGYTYSSSDGLGTAAKFANPTGLAMDAQGNMLVTEKSNGLIRQITPSGVVTTLSLLYNTNNTYTNVSSMPLNYPYGVTVDASGNIFVSDQYYNVIRKLTSISSIAPSKLVTIFAGSGSYGSTNGTGSGASFNQPSGLVTDVAGNLYVADKNNNMIRKITPAGVVTTLAGNGIAGSANGIGTAASFNQPTDLTIDGSGNLYVVDHGNNMIRMITPAGLVTTVVGSITSGSTNGVGTAARLNAPTGITIDPTGKLIITENNTSLRTVLITGYTIDQTLPVGLSFNNTNGAITGTPTVLTPAQTYNVNAYNFGGSSTTTLNIAVQPKTDETIIFPPVTNPTYGDADVALNVSSDYTAIPLTYASNNPQVATIVNGKLHITGTGTVSITVNQIGDATHSAAVGVTRSILINPKQLTITANDATWSYAKINNLLTASYSGFAYGETADNLTTKAGVTTTANSQALVPGIYDLIPSGASALNYTFVYVNGKLTITLPATNFKISSTSVTCKGSNNGAITISPTTASNYTAVITGSGYNQTFTFNATLNVPNLSPGTYHVCVSADNLQSDQQCSDVAITEPKDLTVYATVNKTVNTVSLSLTGGENYTIKINGTEYQTSGSSITLPLGRGSNKISVTTDKLCQGTVEQIIDLSGITAPYPNPFQDILYVNLGEAISNVATIKIFNVTSGASVLSQKFSNRAGVVQLDVSNLQSGVYTLNLVLDGKLSTFKIIKK